MEQIGANLDPKPNILIFNDIVFGQNGCTVHTKLAGQGFSFG